MGTTFVGHFLGPDTHANRPAVGTLPNGTMYVCTTHNKIERIVSGAWADYATLGTGVTPTTIANDTIWDTKGDLVAASAADTGAKLAAGANTKVLTADSAQSTGLKWQLTKDIELKVMDDATVVTTGDGKIIFCVPAALGGCDLTAAHAFVTTVSSSGLPTVQIRNVTQTADMLTTKITIDVSEFTSYTAAAAPVIDTGNDDVATGDLIAVDVDVAGTGAKGLGVILTFTLP